MKKNNLLLALFTVLFFNVVIFAQSKIIYSKNELIDLTKPDGVPTSQLVIKKEEINSPDKFVFSIVPNHSFSCFGIGWQNENVNLLLENFIVKYRTKNTKGKWSNWNEVTADVKPNDTPTNMYWTDAVFTTDATSHTEIELEVNYPELPNLIKVHLFDGNFKTTYDNNQKNVNPVNNEVNNVVCPALPTMITRAQWCGGAASCTQVNTVYTPTYINATHVIIHHGATPDTYTSGREVVQSYYNYHVNTLGWADIGYNYIVDKSGNFYEGRYNPNINTADARGAHAGTSNAYSIGINFPGNADVTLATTAQLQVVEKILAWWFNKKGFDPISSASLQTQDYGVLTLPRISGHKDVGQTSCPGTNLYSKIPAMRTNAKQLITNCSSCNVPSSLAANSITTTSANLSWSAVSNAASYTIQYKSNSSTTWLTTSSTTNSKLITGLSHSTGYSFKVMTNCSSTSSSYSTNKTFTTLTPPPVTFTLGNGTTVYSGHPYSSSYMDERTQYIITKEELIAAGWSATNPYLSSIAFDVTTAGTTLNNFTIRVSNTTASNYSNSNYLSGTTNFSTFTGTVNPIIGWNTYTFPTPYLFNETMNLLITVCFDNSVVGTNSIINSTILSTYQSLFTRSNLSSGNSCSQTTGTQSYYRPNMRLTFNAAATSTTASTAKINDASNSNDNNSFEINVYPNPTNGEFTIATNNIDPIALPIYIYDAFGKLVSQTNFNNNNEVKIDLSEKQAGLYLIIIGDQKKRLIKLD